MNDVPPSTHPPDPRVEQILDLFAREARIERSRLDPAVRADQLGLSSLDVAMALFEIEDRFDIDLSEPPPGTPAPTVGELVAQVIDAINRKAAGPQAASTAASTTASIAGPAAASATAPASAANPAASPAAAGSPLGDAAA